jgi:hypothetical protein
MVSLRLAVSQNTAALREWLMQVQSLDPPCAVATMGRW